METDISAEEAAILTGGSPELMQLVRHITEEAKAKPADPGPLSMKPTEALAAVALVDGEEPSEEDKAMFAVFERLSWSGEQIERYLDARERIGV